MEKSKICDLNLIENIKKKKRIHKNDTNKKYLIKKLFLIIDTIIDTDLIFSKNSNLNNLKFLLLNFIELYININRNIKNINFIDNEKNFINEIVDELIDNVIFRCNNNKEIVKEIEIMKKAKNDIKFNIKHISLISNR
jgi:hypothetical protein